MVKTEQQGKFTIDESSEYWRNIKLHEIATVIMGQSPSSEFYNDKKVGVPLIQGNADVRNRKTIDRIYTTDITKKCLSGDIIMSVRAPVGKISKATFNACIGRGVCAIRSDNDFLYHYLIYLENQWKSKSTGSTFDSINSEVVYNIEVPYPPKEEQQKIATALSDMDNLIESLEKIIEKKMKVKQGTMQQLLTGKKRLSGFSGEWINSTMEKMAECLDHLRKPLSDSERSRMRGNIPYYGANGIVDFINEYMIDDELILLAEDGGHFEEYLTRPIAYKIRGKAWVNNHAHILKAKQHIFQDFLFYSLVHKNILNHIAGGTRSKLTRAELMKITFYYPKNFDEQQAIAEILSDMDAEIEALEEKLEKYKKLKEGMMQELLTGRIRLV